MIGKRWIFVFFSFWGLMAFSSLNSSMNLAIVAMVNQDVWVKETKISDECLSKPDNRSDTSVKHSTSRGEFNWDPYTQGIILGANSYGNVITHLLGGYLASRFGGKYVYGGGIFLMSIFSCMTPLAARAGVPFIFTLRFISGMAEGAAQPAISQLMARWAPVNERGTFVSLITTGTYIGSVLANILTGFLSSSPSLGGWAAIFYVVGVFGCVWFFFWVIFVHSTPDLHPTISKKEFNYIKLSQSTTTEIVKIPWKAIFFSIPFWALIICTFGNLWFVYTFIMSMPIYLETVMRLPIEYNGLIMGINYVSNIVGTFVGGTMADFIMRKFNMKINTIRKLFCTVAFVGSILSYISIPLLGGCNMNVVFFFMLATKLFVALNSGGSLVVLFDMAPQYSGVLSGFKNTITATVGFLSPMFTGSIINDDVTPERWLIVVFVAASVQLAGLIVFLIFGSADVQPWATVQEKSNENKHSEKNGLNEKQRLLNHTIKK